MKSARLLYIAQLEFKTIVQLPIFWILVVLTMLLTFSFNPAALIPSSQVAGSDIKLFVNSKYAMAQYFAFSGLLLYSFLGAIIAGTSVIRDEEANVTQLIHSTSLMPGEYIFGKFVGVITSLGLIILCQMVFAYLAYELLSQGNSNLTVGPFKLENYVIPAVMFALPTLLFFAATAFAFGVWTRKAIVVYAVPALLFIMIMKYCVMPSPDSVGPASHTLLLYLDPSGMRWLIHGVFAMDKGIAFYNTSPLILEQPFIINRIVLFLVVCLLIYLSAVYQKRWLKKGVVSDSLFRWFTKPGMKAAAATRETGKIGGIKSLEMKRGLPGTLAGVFHLLRAALIELSRQPIYYVFILFILGLASELMIESGPGILGTSTYLTAGAIAVATFDMLSILLCLLLLFSTIEILHRDAICKFDVILFTSPVSTTVLFLSRLIASLVLSVGVMGLVAAGAVVFLVTQGPSFVQIWPFLLVWGAFLGVTLVLWVSFVLALYAIFRNRYTTCAIGILVLGISTYCHMQGVMTWTFNWDLLGTLRWTDMGLFELDKTALLYNRLWAIFLALFFFVTAVHFFSRTERDAIKTFQQLRPAKVLLFCLRLSPFAMLPLLLAGYTAYQVNRGFQGGKAEDWAKAYWSQNLATWRDYQPAKITFLNAAIELAPERRFMGVKGTYTMVNTTGENMDVLPFTVGYSFQNLLWEIDKKPVVGENRSGLHLLHLKDVLAPGDSVEVGFSFEAIYPEGFTRNGGGLRHFILPSGVLLSTMHGDFMPMPGFVERMGVSADNHYAEVAQTDTFVHLKNRNTPIYTRFQSRLQITAPKEYTVTATGIKTDHYENNNKTTVQWDTFEPVSVINVMAGKWHVQREGDAAVYFHPAHNYNVDEILQTMIAAKDSYSSWFYPYPWQELRINEFPNLDMNATGFPTNISFSEGLGFMTKPQPGAQLPFVVTAHEVAHQWWGQMLTPAEKPGADVLIEGMANFSTLLLLESEKGPVARKMFSRFMESQYTRSRRIDSERPLILNTAADAQGESVAYNKGAWVMWMLQDQLGRDVVMTGLQVYMEKNAMKDGASPDLSALIDILRSISEKPARFAQFEDQWFNGVVLPEFRFVNPVLSENGNGWRVDATIENTGTGTVEVDVAAVAFMPDQNKGEMDFSGPAVTERLHLLPGQRQSFTVNSDFKPAGIMVDPHVMVLQINRDKAMFVFKD